MKNINVPAAAIEAAFQVVKDKNISRTDLAVTWSCKTLQNWKAMVAVLVPDGGYIEVTHNGDTKETYVDHYKKMNHVVLADA